MSNFDTYSFSRLSITQELEFFYTWSQRYRQFL